MLRTSLAAVCATLALASAGTAAADARIAIGDLDLSSAAGAAAFDARVEAAARTLCRDARRPGSRLSDRRFCEARVRAEAMDALSPRAQVDYALARLPVVA